MIPTFDLLRAKELMLLGYRAQAKFDGKRVTFALVMQDGSVYGRLKRETFFALLDHPTRHISQMSDGKIKISLVSWDYAHVEEKK